MVAIGMATTTRKNTMVAALASMPLTNSGPKPHANTARDAAKIGRPARRWTVVTVASPAQNTSGMNVWSSSGGRT
jgi:hypothetical protein